MICCMLSERFMPMFRWCSAELRACSTLVCVFFCCEFVCPGCESGFFPTLPGCHRWSQQSFFLGVCTRADGQIESALVLWIWNLGLGHNSCTTHCVPLLITGSPMIPASRLILTQLSAFCLVFFQAVWRINILAFIFYFTCIFKTSGQLSLFIFLL